VSFRFPVKAVLVGLVLAVSPVLGSMEVGAQPLPDAKGDIEVGQVIEQGEGYLKRKEWSKAESAFKEALKRDPKSIPAYEGLVKVYQKQSLWKTALEVLATAQTEVGSSWDQVYYQLGYTHRKAGNTAEAIEGYKTYLTRVKDDPDAFYGLGASYEKAGQWAEAVEAYKRYVEVEKRPTEQKWVEKAKGSIKELSAKVPAEPKKVKTLDEAGKKPEPKVEEAVAEAAPKGNPVELEGKGDAAFGSGEYGPAAEHYRGATAADGKRVSAWYKLGVALALGGDLDGAIGAWEQVVELDPSMEAAKRNITRARAKQASRSEGGVDDARLDKDGQARMELASEYVDQGRAAMALRVLDPMLVETPDDMPLRTLRGRALLQLGRYGEGMRELELAYGQRPADVELHGILGQAYLQTGNTDKAVYFLRRYLELADPAGRNSALDPTRQLVERLSSQARKDAAAP